MLPIINEQGAKNDTQTIEYDLWISNNTGQSDMVIVLLTTVFNIPYFISGSNTRQPNFFTSFHFRFKYLTVLKVVKELLLVTSATR